MNQLELTRWAVKAIDAEIKRYSSRLNRYLLIIQAHEKYNPYFDRELAEKQIEELRKDIELLIFKKASLSVQLEKMA